MKRSPFFYVGDKYKLMEQINTLVPKNIQMFVEPFCGGGSVFMNSTAKTFLCNDLNKWQIKLHKFLNSYKGKRDSFFRKFHGLIKKYNLSQDEIDFIEKHIKELADLGYIKINDGIIYFNN